MIKHIRILLAAAVVAVCWVAVSHFFSAADAQVHHNLGRVLASQGKLEEAVDHFKLAIRLQPGFMAARRSLVMALQQQGKTAEASREYAEAMQILNSHPSGTNR